MCNASHKIHRDLDLDLEGCIYQNFKSQDTDMWHSWENICVQPKKYLLSTIREAAAFLRRLSPGTFKQLLPQLPTDLFIESMPHSLPILEALYAKLFLAGGKV